MKRSGQRRGDEILAPLGVQHEGAERVDDAVEAVADEDRRRALLDQRRAGDAVAAAQRVAVVDRDLGEGVALAARAQEIARPAGIAVTEQAYQFLRGRTAIALEDNGVRQLKNIATPMRIWTWPAANAD